MPFRIEVATRPEHEDPRGARVLRQAREHLHLPVDDVRVSSVYKVDWTLDDAQQQRLRDALTDPVIERSTLGALEPPERCHWVITVGFKAGVTDNVGRTARTFVRDLFGDDAPREGDVFTESRYMVSGSALSADDAARLARELLANELIERVQIASAQQARGAAADLTIPRAGTAGEPRAEAVLLPDDDDALLALSAERTLSLSLAELQAIRAHYAREETKARRRALSLPEAPTDVELEALAQTWSEHCKHKIFNAEIQYTDERGETRAVRSLFKTYIVGATERIAERVDWLVSVFHDNAGVVRADDETNLVFKVETHNSPSALDPYGGAMTGIVGVNRDPFGTGRGASLLTNTWGYCLGPPEHSGALPEGLLHPRRIREGVHHGVIDGGNQSGIPYSRGFELFDARFIGKPLVFCGTVGVMPREIAGEPAELKRIELGDHVVMVGGRIGKDGIHGATFSSEALTQTSPAQAVQIGDPITQKKMTDMLLEARDAGLYRTLTDNGAGGLSSSVGEIAQLSGGATIDLARCPLKYDGLMPWEIFLSEAQERMTVAVPDDKLEAFLELAARREVEATAIGRFDDSGDLVVRYGDDVVADLPLSFLHDGCPRMQLEARFEPPAEHRPPALPADHAATLLALLGSDNLCSKERWTRRYDHEVKGLSVVKPLVGVNADVPADATAMRVQHGRDLGVLLAEAIQPRISDVDAGAMGAYVVDLAVRRIVAGGARLGAIAALDNFCWPDPVLSERTPDGPHKLANLVRCCEALAAMTEGLDLPLISGKDSMKNDSTRGGVKISIPPTLLLSVMAWIPDVRRALDLVVPSAEHQLYLLGATDAALGGSELYAYLGAQAQPPARYIAAAPAVDASRTRAVCALLERAHHEAGLVAAAHAPHRGGLALACATLALASGLGLEVDLAAAERLDVGASSGAQPLDDHALLFAESAARLLVAVPRMRAADFEALCERHGDVPARAIGTFTKTPRLRLARGERTLLEHDVGALRAAYTRAAREGGDA
ncbi:MAG: hypothetical protein KC503_21160 [Myxococcales bacterium]|nr:hypothetical protein [Myxococcales bacterium]